MKLVVVGMGTWEYPPLYYSLMLKELMLLDTREDPRDQDGKSITSMTENAVQVLLT